MPSVKQSKIVIKVTKTKKEKCLKVLENGQSKIKLNDSINYILLEKTNSR